MQKSKYPRVHLRLRVKMLRTQIKPPLLWPPVRPSSRIMLLFQFAFAPTLVSAPLPSVPGLDAVMGRCNACMFLQSHEAARKANPKLSF